MRAGLKGSHEGFGPKVVPRLQDSSLSLLCRPHCTWNVETLPLNFPLIWRGRNQGVRTSKEPRPGCPSLLPLHLFAISLAQSQRDFVSLKMYSKNLQMAGSWCLQLRTQRGQPCHICFTSFLLRQNMTVFRDIRSLNRRLR